MRAFLTVLVVLAVAVFAVPLPKNDRKFRRISGFHHPKARFNKFDSFRGSRGFRSSSGSFVRSKATSFRHTFQPGSAEKPAQVLADSKPSPAGDVAPPPPPTDCGYTGETLTADLVVGEEPIKLGELTAVIKGSTVELSYQLTSQDCILIEKLHVNIVDEPLEHLHPSEFPCYATSNQAMLQNFTCPLNLFDVKCCGTKTVYVEGTALCAGEVGTIYAAEPGCSGPECNTLTVEPPCACGCDEDTDKCIDTLVTCEECGGEVCKVSECTPFLNCEGTLDCADQVCDLSECRKKITETICPNFDLFGFLSSRQIRQEKGQTSLSTTMREEEGEYVCAEDCCPLGETTTVDLSYFNDPLSSIGDIFNYFAIESDVIAANPPVNCCPFCETLTDGVCAPSAEECNPCTIGARNACKAMGNNYKWYVAQNFILWHLAH